MAFFSGLLPRAELARSDLHRLHIELVLEPMENLVADLTPIAQSDHPPPLGRDGLVPEPAERAQVLGRAGAVAVADGGGAGAPLRVAGAGCSRWAGRAHGSASSSSSRARAASTRGVAGADLLVGEGGVVAKTQAAQEGSEGQPLEHGVTRITLKVRRMMSSRKGNAGRPPR